MKKKDEIYFTPDGDKKNPYDDLPKGKEPTTVRDAYDKKENNK
jgi:hypothetical protein